MKDHLPTEHAFAGRTIQGYELADELGRGHNGVVYRARRPITDAVAVDVAMKLIPRANLRAGYQAEFEKAAVLSGVSEVVGIRDHFEANLDGGVKISV